MKTKLQKGLAKIAIVLLTVLAGFMKAQPCPPTGSFIAVKDTTQCRQ
jgi:hypothetical protein